MKNTLALAFSLVAVALPVTAASAATTVTVQTGTSTPGTVDTNWTIDGLAAWTPVAIHPNWYSGGGGAGVNGNIDGARWITPTETGTATIAAGISSYATVFTLGSIATAATFTGNFWSDNRVLEILLNGVQIYAYNGTASEFNGAGTTLNQWANVAAGSNDLVFRVQNDTGNSGNPAGLRLNAVFSAVPEPGTWLLMMLGLGAVGFSMRRRQKTQVRFQFA